MKKYQGYISSIKTCMVCVLLISWASQLAAANRPNILFILADDPSPFDLKMYNPNSKLDTPVLDKLASEGMVVDGAYHMGSWSGAVCTPSRHMIMSGRTVWHIPGNKSGSDNPKLVPPDLAEYTMAAIFNRAGYDTMRTCKRGNSYEGANKQFTVRHDSVKRGDTDETGSAWHAEHVLNYLNDRQATKDRDPFLIYFGFSHPHDPRNGKVRETQLFNLKENPGELLNEHHAPELAPLNGNTPKANQVNLANDPQYAKKLAQMEALLLSEMNRLNDPYRLWDQPEKKPYDGTWESLQKMPVPAWFNDGKIGIFIHWGPYSVIGYKKGGGGYAEHVPKLLYDDPEHYYPYMKKRWGAIPPGFGYKDIIPEFRAEHWNPDEWAALFKEVGAHYVVLTAEHHDGWANWDSDLTPWNAVDMGPKRDLVGDLGKAVRAQGLKYAPSYHRERHTGFFALEKYVVHSEPHPDIAEEIKRMPEAASLYGPFTYTKEFVDDYVTRWKEIQEKYQPDFLWMDDVPIFTRDGNKAAAGKFKPEIQYLYDQYRLMITDFMNQGAARGQEVYLNNKGGNRNWPQGVGCLEKDNLKLKVIGPKWQSCTTFGSSFGYLAAEEDPDNKVRKTKTVEMVIHEMVEVISRNGNFLINIGPKADGTIPDWQVERLHVMGDWLKINGKAIYGSRYWKEDAQKNEHLCFTTNGKTLYAIKCAEPTAPFTIEATAGWKKSQVKSVKLLGSGDRVRWEMTPNGLNITPPKDLGASRFAWAFEIRTDREQHHPNATVSDAEQAMKNTRKVNLEGHTNPGR
jgi:alpha-L-fucosidase